MVSARGTRAGASLRLPHLGPGTSDSLWGVCLGTECGLGQCGDGSRYRRLRGRKHSALVERGWTVSVSRGQAAAHQRRWRRKQWLSRALVEMGTATVGG